MSYLISRILLRPRLRTTNAIQYDSRKHLLAAGAIHSGPFLGMVEVIFPGLQLPEDDGKGCPGSWGRSSVVQSR